MQKDILIQELRTRVGEDDAKVISDKTFDGFADNYLSLFEKDDAITDDTWTGPVAALKMFAGQKRHDDKVFAETFKKEYETQHQKDVDDRIAAATAKAIEEFKKTLDNGGDKGGEGDGDGKKGPDTKPADDMDERIRKILGEVTKERDAKIDELKATIENLTKSQKEREKTAQINSVKAALKKHLQDLKANNDACIDDALDSLDFGDEPKFDELKQSAIDAYEKRYKRYYGDGGKPFGGESTGGGGGTGSLIKDHIERAKAQAEDAKAYKESLEFAK